MAIRHFASRSQKVIPKAFMIIESKSLIHTSSFLGKKGGGGSKKSKKDTSKDYIDKMLDDLSDDEDEDIATPMQPDPAILNPNSPVNKFLKNRAKSKGKNLTVTYADVSFME